MTKITLSVLLVVFLTGCASTPKEPPITLQEYLEANVVKNQTTKEQILQLFGKPQQKMLMNTTMPQIPYMNTADLMPYEMWTYTGIKQGVEWDKPKGRIFPLFGIFSYHIRMKTLSFNFNREGIVTGYTLNEIDT